MHSPSFSLSVLSLHLSLLNGLIIPLSFTFQFIVFSLSAFFSPLYCHLSLLSHFISLSHFPSLLSFSASQPQFFQSFPCTIFLCLVSLFLFLSIFLSVELCELFLCHKSLSITHHSFSLLLALSLACSLSCSLSACVLMLIHAQIYTPHTDMYSSRHVYINSSCSKFLCVTGFVCLCVFVCVCVLVRFCQRTVRHCLLGPYILWRSVNPQNLTHSSSHLLNTGTAVALWALW